MHDLRRVASPVLVLALLAACPGDDGGVPQADSGGSAGTASTTSAADTTGPIVVECIPGAMRCSDEGDATETCAPTGKAYIPTPCPESAPCVECNPETDENCTQAARCLGPCQKSEDTPSSAGCSFIANRQLHLNEDSPDGLSVANPNMETVAQVWLYQIPEGTNDEELVEGPIMLGPLELHTFELTADFIQGNTSLYRTGGNYRLQSDVPVIAYHHAPIRMDRGNDSSMLLPESALRSDYVVPSYAPHFPQQQGQGYPTYFEMVALENFTTVSWTPRTDTAGNGLPIPFVAAGTTGSMPMNRYDTVRVAASNSFEEDPNLRDVSGTVITADKPLWVVGASRCSRVPVREEPQLGRCDPLQELLIPLNYWGTRYVGVAAPKRCPGTENCGDEREHWRVYNGHTSTNTITLTSSSPLQFEPDVIVNNEFVLEGRGNWLEFSVAHGQSFVIEGTGVFMPVQYLQGSRSGGEPMFESTDNGDPAMVQMVPVDEWLDTYVFATAIGYNSNFVTIVRDSNSPGVSVDGVLVASYTPVGDFAYAHYELTEGVHRVTSDEPFGIVQVGYSDNVNQACVQSNGVMPTVCHSSYAYPGGMKSVEIYVP